MSKLDLADVTEIYAVYARTLSVDLCKLNKSKYAETSKTFLAKIQAFSKADDQDVSASEAADEHRLIVSAFVEVFGEIRHRIRMQGEAAFHADPGNMDCLVKAITWMHVDGVVKSVTV